MKKIAIITQKMITGGVEKALLAFLESLKEHDYDITLYLVQLGGDLLEDVPDFVKVKLIPGMKKSVMSRLKDAMKYGKWKEFCRIVKYYIILHSGKHNFNRECQIIEKMLPDLEEEYDIAISYHAPSTIPMFYVIDRIKAMKKIVWIHGDVEKTKSTSDLCKRYYEQYDDVVCVSKEAEEVFTKCFPTMKERVQTIHNIIHKNKILALAKDQIPEKINENNIKIVTVGRLSIEKGIDIAVEACAGLVKKGYPVQWFVCGEGSERNFLEEKILEYKLSENFFLLGNKKNPYPYIEKCDIYVQPSRHEGYCLTLAEARVLCKPIVATNFSGAKEQLGNDKGMIVECNTEALVSGIENMLNNNDIRMKYIKHLREDLRKENSLEKTIHLFKENK